MVEILDSEDEELQIALIESIGSSEATVNLPDIQTDLVPEDNLQSVLEAFQVETVDKESVTKLLVMRSDVLNTPLKGLNRKKINFKSSLYIKFSGEMGEDQGGPRREFFRLAMKALQDSAFFEGPENSKIFSHNISLLEMDQYKTIGRLVALSLVQGGPGIHVLHPDLYNLMVGRPSKMEDLEELLPAATCEMLQQLRDADDEDKKDQFLSRYADHLLDLGIPKVYHLVRHEKANLIHIIKKQYIYYR
ncbi:G2/M phase-specific E3 ubiquitin-protein ligase-like [Dreissena polymorpha]|nr:G2/M phase-specific E3 ubiquitin-protein ligase-like [Dreissena polymorpha]